jgi:hypothetical protein
MGMNYGLFDAEGFRRRLQGLTDDELITTGKTVSPEASTGKIQRRSRRTLRSTRFVKKNGENGIPGERTRMKQYFFTNEEPPSQGWSVSMMHATPLRTKEDAEAAIVRFALRDASGCQEFNDYWYVFRESKR